MTFTNEFPTLESENYFSLSIEIEILFWNIFFTRTAIFSFATRYTLGFAMMR